MIATTIVSSAMAFPPRPNRSRPKVTHLLDLGDMGDEGGGRDQGAPLDVRPRAWGTAAGVYGAMPLLTRLVVIAATATVVILEFGRRSLLRPLDVLLSASRRIAAGGAATPLGELGRTVDDMAASVERHAGG